MRYSLAFTAYRVGTSNADRDLAATIGTSPWDERVKKQRRIVGSFTTAPAIQKLQNMLDVETSCMISDIYKDSNLGNAEIQPHIYQKRLALNVMMMFCYGTRFESIEDPLLLGILSDANTIARYFVSRELFSGAYLQIS